jgi:hypothetical protein
MASASPILGADDIAWVKAHAAEVTQTFGAEFAVRDRFAQGQLLLDRFNAAIDSVLKNGRGHFSAVDEAHNEICIASALLANTRLRFFWLEYEPPLPGCAKTIDFRATADNGQIVYVDVKTIKPQAADRWDQFEKAIKEGWIADNVHVVISEEWLGEKSGMHGLRREPGCWGTRSNWSERLPRAIWPGKIRCSCWRCAAMGFTGSKTGWRTLSASITAASTARTTHFSNAS